METKFASVIALTTEMKVDTFTGRMGFFEEA
jgi:hypothetical protein